MADLIWHEEKGEIYALDGTGKRVAEISFQDEGEGVWNIAHTCVDPSLRGQGVASELVERAVRTIEDAGGVPEASCSYAKAWLGRHGKQA